jgi:hypothetical protein
MKWIRKRKPKPLTCPECKGYGYIANGEAIEMADMISGEWVPVKDLGMSGPCLKCFGEGRIMIHYEKTDSNRNP